MSVGVDLAEAQGPSNTSQVASATERLYPHVTVGMGRLAARHPSQMPQAPPFLSSIPPAAMSDSPASTSPTTAGIREPGPQSHTSVGGREPGLRLNDDLDE